MSEGGRGLGSCSGACAASSHRNCSPWTALGLLEAPPWRWPPPAPRRGLTHTFLWVRGGKSRPWVNPPGPWDLGPRCCGSQEAAGASVPLQHWEAPEGHRGQGLSCPAGQWRHQCRDLHGTGSLCEPHSVRLFLGSVGHIGQQREQSGQRFRGRAGVDTQGQRWLRTGPV